MSKKNNLLAGTCLCRGGIRLYQRRIAVDAVGARLLRHWGHCSHTGRESSGQKSAPCLSSSLGRGPSFWWLFPLGCRGTGHLTDGLGAGEWDESVIMVAASMVLECAWPVLQFTTCMVLSYWNFSNRVMQMEGDKLFPFCLSLTVLVICPEESFSAPCWFWGDGIVFS